MTRPDLLIAGGRVYHHDGDIHAPPVRDVLVQGGRIASVTAPSDDAAAKDALRRRAGAAGPRGIEAAGRLVLPGFVNAHDHSCDVFQKGMFDVWALRSQPAYLAPAERPNCGRAR